MWALDSGRVSQDIHADVIEFLMLYQFGILPEVTRKMSNVDVEKILFIYNHLKKKESSESKMERNKWRR